MGTKMKAYVTSMGENTTDLCIWSLERQGFETILIKDTTSLWNKLDHIFEDANDDFLRVDADVVVNNNVQELVDQKHLWWYQSLTFGWFKQDIIHGGVQFIRKECLTSVRNHINECQYMERPESYLSRLEEFHNPRMFGTFEKVCGIHGFGQSDDDTKRAKLTKTIRGRYGEYDWELAERLSAL